MCPAKLNLLQGTKKNGEFFMQVAEEKIISIDEFIDLAENDGGIYEVETPTGWIEIGCLMKKPDKGCFRLRTQNGNSISASNDHYVETKAGWKKLEDIDAQNDIVLTKDGETSIVAIEDIGVHDTFDLEVLSDEHKYYANNIVSHNSGKTTLGNIVCTLAPNNTVIWITPEILSENTYRAISSIKALYKLADFLSPCIIILEDLDLFGQDRETGGDIMSLGALMNVLDGVNSILNSVTVATTNRLEIIESALRSRPGRFDRVIEIPSLNDKLREKMFTDRLSQWKVDKKAMSFIINCTSEWTGAEVQEFVNSLNLKHISSGKKRQQLSLKWAEEIIETMKKFGVGEASSKFGFGKKSEKD